MFAAIYNHALAGGFARGFLLSAGIALVNLVVTIAVIWVRRAGLTGAQQPVTAGPAEQAQVR